MRLKTALVVVDMQNDFLTGNLALRDCPAQQDGEDAVPIINKVQEHENVDLVVYTLDWHPAEHISFVTNAHKFNTHQDCEISPKHAEVYDQLVFKLDGCDEKNGRRDQTMWPPHCIQESWGAQLHPDINVVKNSVMVRKGLDKTVDSYSAFYDNNKLRETDLRKILLEHDIQRTLICGVATDVCVNFTAKDSAEIGFDTYVITDACAGVVVDNIKKCEKEWQDLGIKLITSDSIP